MASVRKRKSTGRPVGAPFRDEPKKPDKVFMVIRLREIENLRWREIGIKMGMTRQAPFNLYKKWRKWASTQKETA